MELKLYMFETCPFCRKVLKEIEDQERTDIKITDIQKNKEDRETLIKVGGKSQVPCLFIDGEPLYESGDIIEWLKEHPESSV